MTIDLNVCFVPQHCGDIPAAGEPRRARVPQLIVRIARIEHGIDLDAVESIGAAGSFRVLSRPHPDVPELLEHRGERIPIIDLRCAASPLATGEASGGVLVVLRIRGRRACVVVDAVGPLVDLDRIVAVDSASEQAASDRPRIRHGWIGGRLLRLIDVDALVPDAVLDAPRRLARSAAHETEA